MSATERLGLPHILRGQAQKEAFHNEALQTLDLLVAGAVEEGPRTVPPASPAGGACYIVGTGAEGAWLGKDGMIAGFTAGGWRFVAPREGMTMLVRTSGETALFRGGSWTIGELRGASLVIGGSQVVGARGAAIANPAGGAQVDTEARAAIGAILTALRQHGLIAS